MASIESVNYTQLNSSESTILSSGSSLLILHVLIGLLDTLLLPSGIIINIIALIVFVRYVNRKPTAYFLRSLAVSDILIPMSVAFLHAFSIDTGCTGFAVMHFFMYLGAVTINAVLALVCEQLLKLVFPGREVFNKTRTGLALAALWILPAIFVYVIPLVYYHVRYTHFESVVNQYYTFCEYLSKQSLFINAVVVRVWVAYCFLALAAIFVMYILIYLNIRKMLSLSLNEGIRNEQADLDMKTRKEMLKLTVLLLLSLVIFWGPILIGWIVITSWPEKQFREHFLLWQFIVLFTLLNPIVDPIIVIVRMADVKKGFRAICCCCCIRCCRKQRGNLEEKSVMYTKTVNTQVEAAEI